MMSRLYKIPLILLILTLLFLGSGDVLAQGDSGVTMTVEAGYDDHYKESEWIPVFITVGNEGAPIEGYLQIEVTAGGDRLRFTTPVSLPTRSQKRVPLPVFSSSFTSSLTVSLHDEAGRAVAEVQTDRLRRVGSDSLLLGVVTSDPAAWTFLDQLTIPRDTATAFLTLDDLPEKGPLWNALDFLFLHDVDSGNLNAAQMEALRGWLGQGGQLLVTGGSGWQGTIAGLEELLPVSVSGTASREDLPALAALADVPFRDEGPYLVTTATLRSGRSLLNQGDLPLLARRNWGRGSVYFLALDPALPPLLDWRGNEALWTNVLSDVPRLPFWAQGPRNGQSAGTAVSTLPSLILPSTIWLLLFLTVYVAVVGPGNYLVLKRIGRRELAWLTIPATIVIFALIAYVTGYRIRGTEVILNQVAIAYGHVGGEQMRVHTLLGIYSPRRATYDVRLPGDVLVRPFNPDMWGSLSGSGNQKAIASGADTLIDDVRVDVSGIETYALQSYRPLPPITGEATLRLEGTDSHLALTVQNNSDATLEKAGVFLGTTFIPLGDIGPGERVERDRQLNQRQASAAVGATGGGPVPVFDNSAVLSMHYEQLLGTPDYYNDPEVRPRFQLLESMQYYGGPGQQTLVPRGSISLVGWTEQPQLDIALSDSNSAIEHIATTLYFLELPMQDVLASGQGVRVPPELMQQEILNQVNVYSPSLNQFSMGPGWVEAEFTPWPTFRGMEVTSLEIVLERGTGTVASQPVPELLLWHWQDSAWVDVPNAVWGSMGIGDFEPFLGEQNQVRLRLENNDTNGIEINAVYPQLTGDLDG